MSVLVTWCEHCFCNHFWKCTRTHLPAAWRVSDKLLSELRRSSFVSVFLVGFVYWNPHSKSKGLYPKWHLETNSCPSFIWNDTGHLRKSVVRQQGGSTCFGRRSSLGKQRCQQVAYFLDISYVFLQQKVVLVGSTCFKITGLFRGRENVSNSSFWSISTAVLL